VVRKGQPYRGDVQNISIFDRPRCSFTGTSLLGWCLMACRPVGKTSAMGGGRFLGVQLEHFWILGFR